jgi:hypothetical protein
MMFLEFFIWGAWFELNFGYLPSLGFDADEQWLILSAFNFGALVALFFSTQFADRKFAAEKFLAFSQLVGGLAILGLFFIRRPEGGESAPFWPFFLLMLVYSLFYVPTISITNSIAFANLKDPQREFGYVRVWGTIGWIVASWPFIFILVDWAKVPAFGSVGIVDWLGHGSGDGQDRARFPGLVPLHFPGRGDRVAGAGGVQPGAAAHAAETGHCGGRTTGLAGGDETPALSLRARPVRGDVHRRGRASELLLLDRALLDGPGRHPQ